MVTFVARLDAQTHSRIYNCDSQAVNHMQTITGMPKECNAGGEQCETFVKE